MLHKEDFCEHFCEMSDKEIVDDIRKSIASFMKQREEGEDFGAKMVHKAKLRIDSVHDVRSDAGKQGGRPRKDTTADGDIREDSQDRKSGTPANHYTAGAPTREDGDELHDTGDRGTLESGTPANHYGDATRREAVDESATISNNIGNGQGTEALVSQWRAGADSVRGTPLHSAPARSRAKNSRCPNSREEFHAFVADNNLHEALAEEWYAIHEARGWVDENGNPIKNWRGALKNFCIKVEQKRKTA